MIKTILKKLPFTKKISHWLFKRKLASDYCKCSKNELKQVEFYKKFITKNSIVFDVGANLGSRAKLFINCNSTVVAYEPQPNLCDHLDLYLSGHKRFILNRKALGHIKGNEIIKLSDAHVLSSMSQRWINATTASGRFSNYKWDNSITVQVSTLDDEITKYGTPTFIKIDVEGYELNVLKGLTKPIEYISIEFTAEDIDNTMDCIKYLINIGSCVFNYSIAESLSFTDKNWIDYKSFKSHLYQSCKINQSLCCDVYIHLNKLRV